MDHAWEIYHLDEAEFMFGFENYRKVWQGYYDKSNGTLLNTTWFLFAGP
jgi:hypothetical protein